MKIEDIQIGVRVEVSRTVRDSWVAAWASCRGTLTTMAPGSGCVGVTLDELGAEQYFDVGDLVEVSLLEQIADVVGLDDIKASHERLDQLLDGHDYGVRGELRSGESDPSPPV